MPSSVDNILLGRELKGWKDERFAEKKMRQRRVSEESGGYEAEPAQSLRQAVFSARRAKEKVRQKVASRVVAPLTAATDGILRSAWTVLIPSWGLSLIYINLHVFMHWTLGGNLFSALGEEWVPKQAKSLGGGAAERGAKALGIAESMGLLFLDLIFIFVVIAALTIIVMLVAWLSADKLEQAKMIWDFLSIEALKDYLF